MKNITWGSAVANVRAEDDETGSVAVAMAPRSAHQEEFS